MRLIRWKAKIVLKEDRIKKLTGEMHARALRICQKYALAAEGHAKELMTGPKSGRLYPRVYAGGHVIQNHVASAPDEAPAVLTGQLWNSFRTWRHGRDAWAVGPTAEHGMYLELGTRKMAPRPFLKPALERVRNDFFRELEEKVFKP